MVSQKKATESSFRWWKESETCSDLWSSPPLSSWHHRRRFPSLCWRCRDWRTALDKCFSGSRSWSLPSLGYSGTRHDDRLHDQSTSGPGNPLQTHSEHDSHVSVRLRDRISELLIYPGHAESATSQNLFFLRVRGSVLMPDDGWWDTAEHFAVFNRGW